MIQGDVFYLFNQAVIRFECPPYHHQKQGEKNEEGGHTIYVYPGYLF